MKRKISKKRLEMISWKSMDRATKTEVVVSAVGIITKENTEMIWLASTLSNRGYLDEVLICKVDIIKRTLI